MPLGDLEGRHVRLWPAARLAPGPSPPVLGRCTRARPAPACDHPSIDPHAITTLEQLREIYPEPAERAIRKELDRLDDHCRDFVARCPFVLLASANARGECDVSPRGGPAGFARVLDDHRLVIPDATGNRRLDSLQNILENPRVGLLFLIPGLGETLRGNGRVQLTRDSALLEGTATGGRAAKLALIVTVDQAYLHCAKCILRAHLWDTETWEAEDQLPPRPRSSATTSGSATSLRRRRRSPTATRTGSEQRPATAPHEGQAPPVCSAFIPTVSALI